VWSMKPGDLVRPVRAAQSDLRSVAYLDTWVWKEPEEVIAHDAWAGKWRHDQIGMLLDGRHEVNGGRSNLVSYVMREVLLEDRIVWVVEEEIEVFNEAR
jgi:hypothetical protein